MSLRVAELYCGIGGCAAALAPLGAAVRVVAALDVSHLAVTAYRHAFPGHPADVRTLESIPAAELAGWAADLWWLSPPCQPFTRRGLGRDLDDPRTASLVALAGALATAGPPLVALENVPGFAGSRTHGLLRRALDAAGYAVRELLLCPTELGWPNRRRRFYLLASRRGWADGEQGEEKRRELGEGERKEEGETAEEELGGVPAGGGRAPSATGGGAPGAVAGEAPGTTGEMRVAGEMRAERAAGGGALRAAGKRGGESAGGAWPADPGPAGTAYPALAATSLGARVRVADLLDRHPDPSLAVDPELVRRYAGALDVVDLREPGAVTACFTAAYGRSPVRSGSYLVTGREPDGAPRLRRFSVSEVLRLLGFPEGFALPPGTPREVGWRLAGNSLSVPAVRAVLATLPGLEGLEGLARVTPITPYPASGLR